MNEISLPDWYLEECIGAVRQRAAGAVEGLFGVGSMVWQVTREVALVFGVGRELLLQLAHPAVAEGVNRYSNFREDLYGRARRTIDSACRIFFGDLETAIATAQGIFALHERVHGTIRPETSRRLANTPYHANDAGLLLWVWATLVDTALLVYGRLNPPLSGGERAQFYEEIGLFAVLMGIPPAQVPASPGEFERYFREMLDGPTLEVGETARALWAQLDESGGLLSRFNRLLGVGGLPERLRSAYGFRWTERERRASQAAWGLLARAAQAAPLRLRYSPAYFRALERVRRARPGAWPAAGRRAAQRSPQGERLQRSGPERPANGAGDRPIWKPPG